MLMSSDSLGCSLTLVELHIQMTESPCLASSSYNTRNVLEKIQADFSASTHRVNSFNNYT